MTRRWHLSIGHKAGREIQHHRPPISCHKGNATGVRVGGKPGLHASERCHERRDSVAVGVQLREEPTRSRQLRVGSHALGRGGARNEKDSTGG
jgi:hypothetical protein